MIKTEFGIIECFEKGEYVLDESSKLIYIDDWWNKLLTIKTYFHDLN